MINTHGRQTAYQKESMHVYNLPLRNKSVRRRGQQIHKADYDDEIRCIKRSYGLLSYPLTYVCD
jgi:hypothetical protein